MVIIRKIVKSDEYISAEYYPEGKKEKGYMKIRLSDKKVVEHKNAGVMAAAHVKARLREFAETDCPPTEFTDMWY